MDQKENQSSQRELLEFLEVAITSIVFLKGIYPPGAFERRRYMNLLVHKARHPQLNHYIHHSVTALVPNIQQGLVDRVAVIFFKDDKIPEERFMLKINVNGGGAMMEDCGELRSLLVKLSLSEPLCKEAVISQGKTPKSKDFADCRWEIAAYFSSVPETGMWVPSNTQQWQQPPLITPIKSMNIQPLSVQLYLEHPNSETAKR